MRHYEAMYTDAAAVTLSSALWEKANAAAIDQYPWHAPDAGHPASSVRLLHDKEGLWVRFDTEEAHICATYTQPNDPVCRDSCVEFFFTPNLMDEKYLGFEINPLGTLLISVGTGPRDLTYLEDDRSLFPVETSYTGAASGHWAIQYFIPYAFIRKHFSSVTDTYKGNFMKCADGSPAPHHGCWNRIETERPQFHVPAFFGRIDLKEGC